MKRYSAYFLIGVIALQFAAISPQAAANAAPATDFTPLYVPSAKIHAQALIDESIAKNPDLLGLAFHAIPPGGGDKSCIIATNLPGRVGSPDTTSDTNAMIKGDIILNPKLPESTRLLMLLPLKDTAGKIVGTLGIVFRFSPDGDVTKLFVRGLALQSELRKQIPSREYLFEPAN